MSTAGSIYCGPLDHDSLSFVVGMSNALNTSWFQLSCSISFCPVKMEDAAKDDVKSIALSIEGEQQSITSAISSEDDDDGQVELKKMLTVANKVFP